MPIPLYLDGGSDPVFALYHEAVDASLDTAVLMCAPFGWEDMCSYRSRRVWAERLAKIGHHTLRFDLPGSGDSGGSARDPRRLGAWSQAVDEAVRWLHRRPGVQRVSAIGIGLGGLIALHAGEAGTPLDEIVLWAVPSRGRTLVRELRAFSRLETSELDGAAPEIDESPIAPDGSLAVAGYLLSSDTLDELEHVELADLRKPIRPGGRALLLERDGRAPDKRLQTALEETGVKVTAAPGDGYAKMLMVEPQDATPAEGVFERVESWLAQASSPADPESLTAQSAQVEEGARTSDRAMHNRGSAPRSNSTEMTLADGRRVRETPLTFSHTYGDPFGILTEPLGETANLCVVWLNAGPQRRTGPNRMWVEAARRWAARGVPSLRLDVAGIGDAGGDLRLTDPRSFVVPAYGEQILEVLNELQVYGLPGRFVVGGLCSGAYWALQMALRDTRVVRAVMLNPRLLVYDGGIARAIREARVLRGKVFEISTWRRVLRGDITFSAHSRTFRLLLVGLLRTARKLPRRILEPRSQQQQVDEIEQLFDRLRDRDHRALMVFAGPEHIHSTLQARGHLEPVDRWPNISVSHFDLSADVHTLRPLWLQQRVHGLIDEALEDELRRLAGESLDSTTHEHAGP